MSVTIDHSLYVATSLTDALVALADMGDAASPLAGATWIMRAPIRQEQHKRSYVGIGKISELRGVEVAEREIRIGACVTHAELAVALTGLDHCAALAQAAGHSANPAVRNVATVGGNLCASAFAASDLVPALLSLDASLELATQEGAERITLERFLAVRAHLRPGTLLTTVIVPAAARRSVHIRLPLRKAGDYPVAIVSLAVEVRADGLVDSAKVAVGSVEAAAKRWPGLETDLVGRPLDPQTAAEQARARADDFVGRDSVDAPGWYRLGVLPALVRRAVAAVRDPSGPPRTKGEGYAKPLH